MTITKPVVTTPRIPTGRNFPQFKKGSSELEAFKTELYLETLQRKLSALGSATSTPKNGEGDYRDSKEYLEKQIKRIFNKLNRMWRSV